MYVMDFYLFPNPPPPNKQTNRNNPKLKICQQDSCVCVTHCVFITSAKGRGHATVSIYSFPCLTVSKITGKGLSVLK